MIVFTCNEFSKDLSNYQVSSQYKNSWFNGALFSVLTFPIEIEIEGFFEPYRGHIETNLQKQFEGTLNMKGKLSKAIFRIMEIKEETIQISIESGLEKFPSWDLKLSDLQLQKLTVLDIRVHAESLLNQSYPAVNYNFPMIHCDFYPDDVVFRNFQKIYNFRNENGFITNSINPETNEIFNHNIMRPFPYILHVLEQGIIEGNCTLHGDIKSDPIFTKTVLIPSRKIEIKSRPETVQWIVGMGDFTFADGSVTVGAYISHQEILHYGKFRLKGVIKSQGIVRDTAQISFNGTTIYSQFIKNDTAIDLTFTTVIGRENELIFSMGGDARFSTAAELELIPMELYDETGAQINYLVDSNVIDLSYHVPDVSFGDLVTYLITQKNYSFDLKNGNEIHMNLLNPEALPINAINLKGFEVKNVGRNLSEKTSFELKYIDTNSDEYPAEKIYFDSNGPKLNNYTVDDDTTPVEIKGIPLPITTASSVTTAQLITDDENKICVAIYDGLVNNQNIVASSDYFKIFNILELNYKNWFEFQLKSVSYTFKISKNVQDIIQFDEKDKLFIYQNYHFVSEMNVTRISPQIEEFELKTFTIKP